MHQRARYTMHDVRSRALKPRDSWWTIALVDPVATRLSLVIANYTPLTPNHLTFISFAFGLVASWLFWLGTTPMLLAGAVVYHVSFAVDCADGKVARLRGTGSAFGEWLDYVFDRLRVLAASIALFGGHARLTGDERFFYIAILVVFLDMLRYLDALKLREVQERLRLESVAARGERNDADEVPAGVREDEVQAAISSRFARLRRLRDWLAARRVRSHLFSGIEFQMFIFVIGPAIGQVEIVTYVSAALLLTFEVALIVKLALATRHVRRLRAERAPEV